MSKKQENPNQIIRKDGKNVFVEALRSAFAIGKVQLKFMAYNANRPSGERAQATIDIYLSFGAFLRMTNDVVNGCMYNKLRGLMNNQDGNRSLTLYQGGTSATSLSASGKARPDGKALARKLSVFTGEKYPFVFVAESGAGETVGTGLIAPRWGNAPEQKVVVSMSADDVKEFFLLIKEEITAYLTYKNMENSINMQKDLLMQISEKLGLDTKAIEEKYAPPSYNDNKQPSNKNGSYNQPQQGYNQQYNGGYTPAQNSQQFNQPAAQPNNGYNGSNANNNQQNRQNPYNQQSQQKQQNMQNGYGNKPPITYTRTEYSRQGNNSAQQIQNGTSYNNGGGYEQMSFMNNSPENISFKFG